MTKEEAIAYFTKCNEDIISVCKDENVYNYEKQEIEAVCLRRTFEANCMAISALKGLDLPNNATNEDALNYMLRQTFPKVIFIRFRNEANLTEGVVMTKEWLDSPYKRR